MTLRSIKNSVWVTETVIHELCIIKVLNFQFFYYKIICRLNPANGTWFLVQTNYDSYEQDPPFFDNRLKPAKKCLTEMTQAVSKSSKLI